MTSGDFRIESTRPLQSRVLAGAAGHPHVFRDRALAVAMAAKSFITVRGQEIRVVHVPTGEVVFRKGEQSTPAVFEEA